MNKGSDGDGINDKSILGLCVFVLFLAEKPLQECVRRSTHRRCSDVCDWRVLTGIRPKETLEKVSEDEMKKQSFRDFREGMSCAIDGC
jgi:hypothetical protein